MVEKLVITLLLLGCEIQWTLGNASGKRFPRRYMNLRKQVPKSPGKGVEPDMATLKKQGLARAEELYQQRDRRAKELKKLGQKVVGFMCSFMPLEFLTAADLVPYRIMGNLSEPITEADSYLEPNMCPYVRNIFELGLKGRYDFLDSFVVPHACDSVQRIYGLWKYHLAPPHSHFLNIPHTLSPSSLVFVKEELAALKEDLGKLAGREISDKALEEAIALHNENRALVRGLYELRKKEPPLLSGAEMMPLLVMGMSLPAPEFNSLLKEAREEALSRKEGKPKKAARLLIYGSIVDDLTLVRLAEQCGANVVTDDYCIGARSYLNDVKATADPLDGLVEAYFVNFMCPRTYRGRDTSRFQYLLDRAREFQVKGIIAYTLKYCDPHMMDYPDLRDFLQGAGLPVLYIEDDYTMAGMGQLRTRIQAFVEMLG